MKLRKVISLFVAVAMMVQVLPLSLFANDGEEVAESYTVSELVCTDSLSLADNDELLEGYIEELFGVGGNSGIMLAATYTGEDALSGMELEMYNQLKTAIESIAAGERTSTTISLSGIDYSYSDLGITFMEEIGSAINERVESVVYFLLADCPYELYWFDKTHGYVTSYSSNCEVVSIKFYVASDYQANGSDTTVDSSMVTQAKAAAEYAQSIVAKYSSCSDEEKLEAYKDEICALVSYESNYSNLDYGDVWQLVYVFDQDTSTDVVCEGYSKAFQYLCDLGGLDCITVSGTMTGATGAGSHMWNVVYLNGVNYLVDVTNSDSGSVGQDGGLFMVCADDATESSSSGYTFTINNRNVVYVYGTETLSMYPTDYLTLGSKTTTHTHTYGDPTFTWSDDYSTATATFTCADNDDTQTLDCTVTSEVTTAATCVSTGVKTYTATVTFEGTTYTDTKTETLDMVDHNYEAVVTDPTCTEGGYTTYTCSVCGESYTADETEATEHIWDEGVVTTKATCTEDGVMTYTCTVCGATKTEVIEATGHDYGNPVWDWADDYSYAQLTLTCANGSHGLITAGGAASTIVSQTCEEDGSIVYVVMVEIDGVTYSDTQTVVLNATGHNYGSETSTFTFTTSASSLFAYALSGDTLEITLPSSLSDEAIIPISYTLTVNGVTVSLKGSDGTGSGTYTQTVDIGVSASNYSGSSNATIPQFISSSSSEIIITATVDCSAYASDCTISASEVPNVSVTYIPESGSSTTADMAVEKSYEGANITWAWSDDYGTATATFVCLNDSSHTETVNATVTVETTKDVTCEDNGETTYIATVIFNGLTYSDTITAEIPSTGHDYVATETSATCTEGGITTYVCSNCGDTYTDNATSALGHDYESKVTTEPTCTEKGVMTYTCTRCGDTYTEEIAALGHKYEAVVTEPTCTEKGYTTYTCSVCGDSYVADETDATGHTASEAVKENEVAATCTTDGSYDSVVYCSVCAEEISRETVTVTATGHTASEAVKENEVAATCTTDGSYESVVYCSVCGEEVSRETVTVSATGHTASEAVKENEVVATCTTDGSYDSVVYCSVCGEEISRETITVSATGHTASEAVKENEVVATCTTDGSYESVVYCSVCGEEISRETVTVTATGHTEAEAVVENEVAATCTTDGSYDSVVYCSVCGEEISRETVTVTATGHTASEAVKENEVAATCTTDGYYDSVVYCSVCGEEISRETIKVSATGHTASEAVKENEVAATCTADGSYDSVVYCSVCGEEISRETIKVSAAHSWDGGVITTPASCTTDGIITYTCTVCGETYAEAISATGHTAGTAVRENVIAATRTTDGSYDLVTYCTVCGEELSRETVVVPATGVDMTTIWLATPANYSAVNALIAQANALNPDDYTNFSEVTAAINAIDWNLSVLSQSIISGYVESIETAIANLIPVGTTSEDISIDEPIESTDTETEDEGEDEGAMLGWVETSDTETNPTTGIVLALVPMAMAALVAVTSKRR